MNAVPTTVSSFKDGDTFGQEPVPFDGTGLPNGYGKATPDYRTDLEQEGSSAMGYKNVQAPP